MLSDLLDNDAALPWLIIISGALAGVLGAALAPLADRLVEQRARRRLAAAARRVTAALEGTSGGCVSEVARATGLTEDQAWLTLHKMARAGTVAVSAVDSRNRWVYRLTGNPEVRDA